MPPTRRRARRSPRPRGTGSIYREDAGFRAEIVLASPQHPDGRRYRKRFDTHEEASDWLDSLLAQTLGSGVLPSSEVSPPTLREYATQWLAVNGDLAVKTREVYNNSLTNWIYPVLGDMRLDRIQRPDIQRLVNHLAVSPSARGTVSSLASQRIVWRNLRTILNDAREDGRISVNPMLDRDRPTLRTQSSRESAQEANARRRSQVIPDHITRHLVRILNDDPLWRCSPENHHKSRCRARWLLAFTTGIRQGEAGALLVEDVEFTHTDYTQRQVDGGVLTIRRHLERTRWQHGCSQTCGRVKGSNCPERTGGGMHLLPGLKNRDEFSSRSLHVPRTLAVVLREHLDTLTAQAAGAKADPLFPNVYGELCQPEQDSRAFKGLLRAAEVPVPYSVHMIRHTALTVITNTVSLHQAQRIAGHGDVRTTQGYVHDSGAASTVDGVEGISAWIAAQSERALDEVLASDPGDAPEPGRTLRSAVRQPHEEEPPW